MEPTSVTVKILEQIRDATEQTNARLDQTNARLDQTNARLDQTNARLELGFDGLNTRVTQLDTRITQVEIRVSTGITAIAGQLGQVKELLEKRLDLRDRVDRCEQDIHDLQVKTGLK